MFNPIFFQQINIPMVRNTVNNQTNPIKTVGLKADVFERSNISFTSVDDTREGKAIRELGGVICPYTGIPMINGKEISHLNKNNLSGRSDEALKLLKPFEARMQPMEKQVFGLLENLSKKNPEKNLRQLLDKVRPEHLEIIKTQECLTLDKMTQVKFEKKEDLEKINKLVDESKGIIEKQDANYIFRRRRFMEKLEVITEQMKDKKAVEELNSLAEELPRAHDTMSSFIVKYTQKDPAKKTERTPYQIGLALVTSSVGSIEHIKCRHPKDGSPAGANDISNYIYASKRANSLRANMPFDEWVSKNPQVKGYMQQYIDGTIDKINNKGAMKGFRAYPVIIAKTLEKESKGQIKLDTSKLKISKQELNESLVKYGFKPISSVSGTKKPNTRYNGNKHFSCVA